MIGVGFVMVLMSAAQGVFVAALYRYATHGEDGGFPGWTLSGAFRDR